MTIDAMVNSMLKAGARLPLVIDQHPSGLVAMGVDEYFTQRATATATIFEQRQREVTVRALAHAFDETTLTGLVMTLTGGSANPATVRHHIRRLRAEEAAE